MYIFKSFILKLFILLIPFISTVLFSCGQNKKPGVSDYLNSGGEISFDNVKYKLVWSSHPSENYYKQEYSDEKDKVEKYKKLILLEVLTDDTTPENALNKKITELENRKSSDPMVNYNKFAKGDELMIDFLVSSNLNEDNGIIERNVYRYKPYSEKNGKTGTILFGVSERAYGKDADSFLSGLKQNKTELLNKVGSFIIPEVSVSK